MSESANREGPDLRYRDLLLLPGIGRAFGGAALGRLAYAALPVALLLTVQRATGSFGVAGSTLAAFGVLTLLAPLKSRLIDRLGARAVLPPLGVAFAASLIGVVIAAGQGVRSHPVYVALGALVGLTSPLLGPVMRTLWGRATPDGPSRQRAYSLDTVAEECLYITGPVLVAALVAASSARLALTVTAVLALIGSLGLAWAAPPPERSEPVSADPPTGWLGPLRHNGFRALLMAMAGAGLGLGVMDVTVTARATEAGHPAASGYLLAAVSVGSAVGGIAWGHLRLRARTSTLLAGLLLVLAVGLAVAGLATPLVLFGVVLAVMGLASAPLLITSYLASDQLALPQWRAEATTWVNTANNVFLAGGAAAAGKIVDAASPRAALLVGGAVLVPTALAVLAARGRLDERPA